MTDEQRTDEELAAAAREGDRRAYDVLVRRFLRSSMALAWQYTRDVADAEDVVQEAFHRAVRALPDYDPAHPFSAWFYTILRNTARSAVGKDARRAALAPVTVLDGEPAGRPGPDPLEIRDLERALESLPRMQQACLRLCDVEGFTSVEAAGMLGIGDATVRTHLHRARRQLRAAVGPRRGILPS